jgi:hypothetical protein
METRTAPALSTRVFNVLTTRFPEEMAPAIASALSEKFPGVPDEGPLRERVQASILKLTLEREGGMDAALRLARADYRDLFMNADLGDPDAHVAWLEEAAR